MEFTPLNFASTYCSSTDLLSVYCVSFLSGSSVAEYCGRSLHTRLFSEDEFKSGDYTEAMQKAFLDIDEDLKKGVCWLINTHGTFATQLNADHLLTLDTC